MKYKSFIVVCIFAISGAIFAQTLHGVLDVSAQTVQDGMRSQEKINKVVEETRGLVDEYNAVTKALDGLVVYNTLLERQISHQKQEMADLERSIDQVTVVERQIMPLMLRMVDGLEQFVDLDIPFLEIERHKRVQFLRTLAERSDVTVAEKFRRVLEAYQIENDYGRTIEAYKGSLELDGNSVEVDFLRIGRIALYYLSMDSEHMGTWDQTARQWVELSSEYRNQIRQGIRIARKRVAPNLLLLPVPAAEVIQ